MQMLRKRSLPSTSQPRSRSMTAARIRRIRIMDNRGKGTGKQEAAPQQLGRRGSLRERHDSGRKAGSGRSHGAAHAKPGFDYPCVASSILIRCEMERAPNFSMIRARWCSVVRMLISSFPAITLFGCPSINSARISVSRGVSDTRRVSISAVTALRSWLATARWDASRTCPTTCQGRTAFRQSPLRLPSMQPLPWGYLRGQ